MPRAWVTVVTAILILLALAMVLHRSRRGDETDSADAGDRQRRAVASIDRKRLAARPGQRFDDSFGDSSESASINAAVNRARERAETKSDSEAAAGGAVTQRNAGDEGENGTAPEGEPGTVADGSTKRPAGAAGAAAQAGASGGASATPGAGDDDPNAPAVSFKFDKSTLPEKGDAVPLVESGVTLDENGARFSEGAQFAIQHPDSLTGTSGTVTFSILPDWSGDPESNASFFQWRTTTFENRIQIFKNGRFLRFIFCDNTGVESGVGTDISNWRQGESHFVAATWGDGITGLYVDGRSAGYQEYNGEFQIPPGTPWLIGSDYKGGAGGARGSMKDFHYDPRALSADEVAARAAQPH